MLHPEETYRLLAAGAERAFENARDPEAKRFAAAQLWRALAELAQRRETEGPSIRGMDPHREE